MADFDIADKIVRGHEGRYANNPKDRGGETYMGIARRRFPNWSGWAIVDGYRNYSNFPKVLDADIILQKLVRAFFKENFWNELSLDQVNDQPIAIELYDTGVNMGTGAAAIFLQRVLNVTNKDGQEYPDMTVDARIGPTTIKALNGHKRPGQVLKLLNCLQGARYIDIAEHDHSQEIFMNSWSERIAI
jgi:lysozyme family protein